MSDKDNAQISKLVAALGDVVVGEKVHNALSALVFSAVLIAQDNNYSLQEVQEALMSASEHLAKQGDGEAWA